MAAPPKKHPKQERNVWGRALHQLHLATGDPAFSQAYETLKKYRLAELGQRDADRRLKQLSTIRRGRELIMMAKEARTQLIAAGTRPSNRKINVAIAKKLGMHGKDASDAGRKRVERALKAYHKIKRTALFSAKMQRYQLATPAQRQAMFESRRRRRDERLKSIRLGRHAT